MKRNTRNLVRALAILFAAAFTTSARADLFTLTDVNPDPNIFECDVTAIEKDVTIGGATVHAFNFKDGNAAAVPASAGIPIQVIKVKVGDEIICRFKNELTVESASIHWHGIELDNDSDGTAVTQDAVLPGQRYTYKFKTFRPGIFWFHSHMLPGNTLFGGMYGVIIIENPIEASLVAAGTLPAEANTFTLAMSDIEFDPATGNVGKQIGGMGAYHTENELIAICHLFGIGDPGGMMSACGASTKFGSTVLVNGQTPDAAAQTPKFIVPSGKRIRLRLLNESISRHFRLKLLDSGDNKLYRIGGQGGLLDNVILEGGIIGTGMWNTQFDQGEIQIGSGVRADVLIYPTGSEGSIIKLVGNPTSGSFQISGSLPPNYPIAYFQISGSAADPAPAAGDPILEGTAEDIENIKSGVTITPLVDPAPNSGSSDETIRLTTATPTGPPAAFAHNQPGVDQYAAVLDSNAGNGDWLLVPRPPVARYANIGDILELSVRNESQAAHPYHLHGFSMQPVRMVDNTTGNTLYEFDYDEFLDTIDVQGFQTYVFRTRIDDRPKICDEAPGVPPDMGPVLGACTASPCGGVVGRWLFHCHIVSHGALGMIGEVTILEGVDGPPQITCPDDITQDNDPTLCSAVVTFADPAATDDCGIPTVVCGPPSGSVFPVGDTTVTCTATDSSNQTADCTFQVTVEDKEPPTIASSVAVPMLWPPNHALINVGLSATATDNCPGAISLSVAVFGDEDDELPVGDGNFSPDAKNIAIGTLRLRAERVGSGDGRVYLIVITATDAAGNTKTACHTVVVPKSPSQAHIASVNAQAAAAQAYCILHGTPPPGFVVIGDGPVIGPKQSQGIAN
jgi:FtsP/CotA-like multicopper oxidase with cupredoxin domain